MHYWNDGVGWGGVVLMATMMLVFWGAIAWIVVTGIRHLGSGPRTAAHGADALRILDERFARGEIDDDEYRRRRELLRGA
ncbi:MAG TPA: SHOCT domain-containing protein [Acidimicrobiia bacterium]|nr:SHOCT domain-containing protein [Acidimicrobiia bacterium]